MKINLKIHPKNHLLKAFLGTLEYALTKLRLNKNGLYVVNYHGTQKKFLYNLEEQLLFFKKHFRIVSPQDLNAFYDGKLKDGPFLLLTFDDGMKNNLMAAQLLNQYNIKAFFFIIPQFIDTPVEKQKAYFIKHIRPIINASIDTENEDFQSLNWKEVNDLIMQGHGVGSHTYTHTLVSSTDSLEKSTHEIKESKETILLKLTNEEKILNSFCSINNTLESIGSKEVNLIDSFYTYHFTTIPGVNLPSHCKLYIKRFNIESHWLTGAVRYALGTWDLKRWETADSEYLNLLNKKNQ